jgi:hypothetical protein
MSFTRRSFVQCFAFLIGGAAARRGVPTTSKESEGDSSPDESNPTSTLLERFLRSRGIKPSMLARQSGYSRQFLLRLRMGRMEPSPQCIAALVCACRELTRDLVRPEQLFSRDVIRHSFRSFGRCSLDPHEQDQMDTVFGRRENRDV